MRDTISKIFNSIQTYTLKKQILEGKKNVEELNVAEKQILFNYLISHNDVKIEDLIFRSLTKEEKTDFIGYFYKKKMFFHEDIFEKFYDDFLKICFENGYDDYLFELAKIALNDRLNRGVQLDFLVKYFDQQKRNIIAEINELYPRALGDNSFTASLGNEASDNEPQRGEAEQQAHEAEQTNDKSEKKVRKDNIFIKFFRWVKRKRDIKNLLKDEKYEDIIMWSNVDSNLLSEIPQREIDKLFGYAKSSVNLDAVHKLFDMVNEEKQKETITYYHNYNLSYGGNEVMEAHFDLFLDVSIERNYPKYVYKLALIAIQDKEKYAEAIQKIREYVLKAEPSEEIFRIAELVGIKKVQNTEEARPEEQKPSEPTGSNDKVLNEEEARKGSVPSRVTSADTAAYYNSADVNLKEEILKSFLAGKPKVEDYIQFIEATGSFMDTYKTLPNIDIPIEITSEYLYAMLLISKDENTQKSLIDDILYLNSFATVAKLMSNFTEAEQNKYVDKAAKGDNEALKLTMACTTNCSATRILIISLLLAHDTNAALFLISNSSPRNLNYILMKILDKDPVWYLALIRKLVGHPRHETAIRFIFNNGKENLFDGATISYLQDRLAELSIRDSGFGRH